MTEMTEREKQADALRNVVGIWEGVPWHNLPYDLQIKLTAVRDKAAEMFAAPALPVFTAEDFPNMLGSVARAAAGIANRHLAEAGFTQAQPAGGTAEQLASHDARSEQREAWIAGKEAAADHVYKTYLSTEIDGYEAAANIRSLEPPSTLSLGLSAPAEPDLPAMQAHSSGGTAEQREALEDLRVTYDAWQIADLTDKDIAIDACLALLGKVERVLSSGLPARQQDDGAGCQQAPATPPPLREDVSRQASAAGGSPTQKRVPVQISAVPETERSNCGIYTLANDGTVWWISAPNMKDEIWVRVPDLPQDPEV